MARARPLVVLVAGDPIDSVRREQGSFAELVRAGVGSEWQGGWVDVDLRDGSPLPELSDIAGILVTGSASSVTERAPWMLRAEDYLRSLVRERIPTFGICFGHQLLGQGLGGHVARNPRGREIGTVEVELLAADPLLDGTARPFRANATHVDVVERLPEGAAVLARTALDPHAAVRFSEAAWGVQFHPEINGAAIRGYLHARRDIIALEGLEPDALIARADDAPEGASTLRHFARLVSAASG
jgi:GMP synthase (glutamine-hydrolysing)